MKKELLWFLWYWHRPKSIRKVARKYKPWIIYTLKETGQKCAMQSIFENGTISCYCWYNYGNVDGSAMGDGVFGIDPESLLIE